MNTHYRLLAFFTLALLFSTCPALAQWSDDAYTNLSVGFGAGEQVVPHAVVIADGADLAGSTYVGWYNNGSGNYDVALQLLTADGEPLFAPGGIIVSAQPQNSWVMDWALAADGDGNALVSFADIRDGNSNIQIYKISPNGDFLWGPDGLSLTTGSDFKGPPTVTATANGDVVVCWMQDASTTGVRMQRLSSDGTEMFAAGGLLVSEASDMAPAGNILIPTAGNDVILAYTPTYTFMSNRQIKAQRFDSTGAPVWPTSVMVMDDATLPMGHYFKMTPSGDDGALLVWDVATGMEFGARAQHLTAGGIESMPHNGASVNASGGSGQLEPSGVYDPATGETTVAFIQMNGNQNQRGLFVQRFDATGNRLWNSAGNVLQPQDTTMEGQPQLVICEAGIMGVFFENDEPYGADRVMAFMLTDDGQLGWDGASIGASLLASSKGDLVAAATGSSILGFWSDDRADANDILGQNVNSDGTLGGQIVSIEEIEEPAEQELPGTFAIYANYPNPFNPSTTISFDLPQASAVSLRIYDIQGRLVRELLNGSLAAAQHHVQWDGKGNHGRRQPSGVYYYRLVTDTQTATRTMTLVK